MLSVSKETLRRWDKSGKLKSRRHSSSNYRVYAKEQLKDFPELAFIFNRPSPAKKVRPTNDYKAIELFAGAGGLALGLEKAGFECVLLNDFDKYACETLKKNRPAWNVIQDDIRKIDFKPYRYNVDLLAGGFPCQAFSYAGKKLGFEDTRGTLFHEYARAVNEIQPDVFLAENVRGLLNHDGGRTLSTMISVLEGLGYHVYEPRVLKAIFYRVPQKRERLIIVGVRKDLHKSQFEFPSPYNKIYTVKDALKAGELYPEDVPASPGQKYPEAKAKVLSRVPPGGYWKDLPLPVQKAYMKKSFYLGGGKTGIARRMSWDEPCLTLTCAPAQMQTERCHPVDTRPFTVREYARIQTFPDEWIFQGSIQQQYKQIGNAVPVNLGFEIGKSLVSYLNSLTKAKRMRKAG